VCRQLKTEKNKHGQERHPQRALCNSAGGQCARHGSANAADYQLGQESRVVVSLAYLN